MLFIQRVESLRLVGVAGIRDFTTVKCLHCHLAHHLARPDHGNRVGEWTAQLLLELNASAHSALRSLPPPNASSSPETVNRPQVSDDVQSTESATEEREDEVDKVLDDLQANVSSLSVNCSERGNS